MRVGVMFPISSDPAEIVPFAGRAEDLGYDFVACGEHLFFHGPVTNAFVTLAAAAAATTRVRLLSALTILPVYPAVLAAKQAVTLDRISGGRFDLGVGVGGEHPSEFAAAGSPLRSRGRRTDDALDLMQQLFTGKAVDYANDEIHLDRLTLDPPPMQAGGPPIWVGGRKEVALRRVARFGDVWLPYVVTADQMSAGMSRLSELVAEAGRPAGAVRGGFFGWGAVDRSGARAKETAVRQVSATYQQDFAPLADKLLVTGTPGEVVDRLGAYAAAGAVEFLFAPAATDDDTVRGMVELFAAEVLPQVRDLR
ncbi:MAG: LLM class flavin-dependent oxidoreductase [Actinomycetota bacterium]|nr:LLM class flavin-dependent oxidoreductase [Actinomycetota bacterium]